MSVVFDGGAGAPAGLGPAAFGAPIRVGGAVDRVGPIVRALERRLG